jgi:hypothetical protein
MIAAEIQTPKHSLAEDILAIFIRAGKLQMAVDLAILTTLFYVVDLKSLLASVIGAVALNLVTAPNAPRHGARFTRKSRKSPRRRGPIAPAPAA